MQTKLKEWNAVYRHSENGQWFISVKASFDSKQDAIHYIEATREQHLELMQKKKLEKDSQYKPS